MTVLFGIITRRAVVYVLGVKYQGIDGLFTNVISMLSVAELGLGTAIISNLYQPISENDQRTIASLMSFYRKCYRVIAVVILLLGLAIIPALPWMIKDYDLPYPVAVIYLWYLADSVCSYLLSYRRSLFIADQKNYVVLLFDMAYTVVSNVLQIILLYQTKNFIVFLAVMVIARAAENAVLHRYASRSYPYLDSRNVSKLTETTISEIRKKVNGAVFHKIGGFVVLGTDNILISKFLGLAAAGIYSNYYLIIRSIQSICTKVISASTASVGNLLTRHDWKENRKVFSELTILNLLLAGSAGCGFFCVATPVVELVFGKDLILDRFTLLVLAINLFVRCMREVYISFKEAAGIFYEDRFSPLIESLVNIVASLLFMKTFGLAGVFIGTIVSSLVLYLYTYPTYVCRDLLGISYSDYFKEMLWHLLAFALALFLSETVCGLVNGMNLWVQIALKTVLSASVSLGVILAVYCVWKKEFYSLIHRLIQLVKK